MTSEQTAIQRHLLDWYDENRRDLPWRRTRDPYSVWVSEIMLQQTTVRTVEPRWRRFLDKYPTVSDLARASEDDVLAEWSGLGYYARARNLHAAARRIAEDFGGEVPSRFELLLALPGMGRYTAAAVASIAHGEPVPVVDANVERVIARLDAIEEPVASAPVKRRLWERARELLDTGRAGDWNQAMMELGAVVCLPRDPRCTACPVARDCSARAEGKPESYPRKAGKTPLESAREIAVILRRGKKVLVLRRPARGSFASMWELPRGKANRSESRLEAARRVALELTGLDVKPGTPVLRLKHTVMRQRIELTVFEAEIVGSARIRRTFHEAHEWVAPAEWARRPISTTQKDIALFLAHGTPPRKRVKHTRAPEQSDLFDA